MAVTSSTRRASRYYLRSRAEARALLGPRHGLGVPVTELVAKDSPSPREEQGTTTYGTNRREARRIALPDPRRSRSIHPPRWLMGTRAEPRVPAKLTGAASTRSISAFRMLYAG